MRVGVPEHVFAKIYYLFFGILVLWQCFRMPMFDWDMVTYIAAAKSFDTKDSLEIHTFTFEEVRRSVPTGTYKDLTGGYPGSMSDDHIAYRRTIFSDPSALAETLPFLKIRLIYNGCIYFLYKLGVNIVFATYLISGVAVFVGIIFLYFIARDFLSKPLDYVLPPMALVFGLLFIARESSPDGLAFLGVIVTAYLFLKDRIAILMILPILIVIRTDLILFSFPFLVFLLVSGKYPKTLVLLSVLVSVSIYWFLGWYYKNPGWATLFYHTFVELLNHPISAPHTVTVFDYFYTVRLGLKKAMYDKAFVIYLVIAAYSLYLVVERAKLISTVSALTSKSSVMALLSVLYIGIHFVLFPVPYERFFVAQYVLGTFALLAMITERQVSTNSSE